MSLEGWVDYGNGISAWWEDGQIHNLVLLTDLLLPRKPQMVLNELLTSR